MYPDLSNLVASAELELPPESLDGACYVVDDENEGDDEEKMEVHVYVVILELFSYICIIIWRILFFSCEVFINTHIHGRILSCSLDSIK